MTLRCLFVDFDSFFASVEQHDDPSLRERPIAVVPVKAETTCCLAASYEAKKLGIRTGTGIAEAREKCPEIELVLARPARYIEMHKRFMDAIQDCIPHGEAASIDEVPCYLIGRERRRGNATAIAHSIKARLIELGISPAMTCSIGIAPNKFLAKTASDMNKPDGLTVIEQTDLPHALHPLALRDFCGIGPSMERRLRTADIHTSAQLCSATRAHLRAAWGGIEGERYWLMLRGFDVPERKTTRGSIGHSHVLGPELRNFEGMRAVLFKLLAKAAMRMRHEGYLAKAMAIHVRFLGLEQRFERDVPFAPIDDTPTLLRLLGDQLQSLSQAIDRRRWNPARHPPLSVAVTLVGLEPASTVSAELMQERERAQRVNTVLDRINGRYGNNALYFGAMQHALDANAAPMRIPFSTIPDTVLEQDVVAKSAPSHRGSDHELWLQRERQFKVLAEHTHREAQRKRNPFKPSGVGGWTPKRHTTEREDADASERGLF